MSHALLNGLRARGVDVLSALEAGMVSSSDEQQLDFATTSTRSIYSYNVSDFCRLHAAYLDAGKQHSGIIVCNRLKLSLGEQIRRLAGLVNSKSEDGMMDRIEFL